MSGKGNAPIQGNGPNGDLYINLSVTPHKIFKRDHADILVESKIPLSTALLGGKIKIPTIDGDVELTVQPGTQPGEKQIMRKRGVQKLRDNDRGDQIVTLKVEVPKVLTEKQKSLLMEAFNVKGESEKESFFGAVFGSKAK